MARVTCTPTPGNHGPSQTERMERIQRYDVAACISHVDIRACSPLQHQTTCPPVSHNATARPPTCTWRTFFRVKCHRSREVLKESRHAARLARGTADSPTAPVVLRTMSVFSALAWLSLLPAVLAAPTLESRQTISALSTSQIATFPPFTHYASTAYCKPASTLAWNCGANCQANPTFEPVASGGDGGLVQFCELWGMGLRVVHADPGVSDQGTSASTRRLRACTSATCCRS